MSEPPLYLEHVGRYVRINTANSGTYLGCMETLTHLLTQLRPSIVAVPTVRDLPLYRLETEIPTDVRTDTISGVVPLQEGDLERFLSEAHREYRRKLLQLELGKEKETSS